MSRNRGRPRSNLRDLSTLQITIEERSILFDHIFKREDPIAIAVLGAVGIEAELDHLLRRRFPKISDDEWKEMHSENGPLHSFHAKIVLGRSFRIYNEKTSDDLHIVRKIRNAFAHSKRIIKFDHELILRELRRVQTYHEFHRFFKKSPLDRTSMSLIASKAYICLCADLGLNFLRLVRRKNRENRIHYRFWPVKATIPTP